MEHFGHDKINSRAYLLSMLCRCYTRIPMMKPVDEAYFEICLKVGL